MKLKTITRTLLLSLAVSSACILPAMAAPAAPATTLAPAYAKDLNDILDGLPFYEAMVYAKVPDNYNRAMRDYFVRRVSKKDLNAKLVPRLAEIVPQDLAASVAPSMRHPAYQHRLKAYVAEWGGTGEKVAPLTAEENKALQRIDAEVSGKRFAELMPKISDLLRSTMASIREELDVQLAREALNTIQSTQAELAKVTETGRPIDIRTIGFGPWDQIIVAMGNSTQKMALTFHRYNAELEKMDFLGQTNPGNIVTKQNFDEAASVVNKAEDALAIALKDLDGAIHDREQDIGKSDFAGHPKFRAKMDEVVATLYTFAGDVGEAYRRMFSAQRQLIDFLKQRKDLARLEGKTIIFEDEANVAAVNDLLDRIVNAANEVEVLVKRQTAREDAEFDKAHKALKKS